MRPARKLSGTGTVIISAMTLLIVLLPLLLSGQLVEQQHPDEQNSEFKINPNGLIYGEQTVKQLRFIIDSLNLKFKACELHKNYLSKYQAKAHYMSLVKGDFQAASSDLKQNLPLEAFLKKYPEAQLDENLLVIKSHYTNYEGKKEVEFRSVALQDEDSHTISFEDTSTLYSQPLKGRWVFRYWPASDYSEESIEAFYFPEKFRRQPLPQPYARMVQYSNCMIDTTTQMFLDKANMRISPFVDRPEALNRFMEYVHQATNRPEIDHKIEDSYWERYRQWYQSRLTWIDENLAQKEEFQSMLADAIAAALERGGSHDEFEEYVARYHTKKKALELKRSRQVMGMCSMDDSPRLHALSIAQLSAETVSWETFLRAHLDIMNDRFDRATDGSYAWAGRKTYIRELEVLDINVPDLLFGISLRIGNPDKNHYYGDIGRLGRALTETEHPAAIEKALISMISDQRLDDYNRILMYYLFLNYNYHLDDKSRQKKNIVTLNRAVEKLPPYLAARAVVKE